MENEKTKIANNTLIQIIGRLLFMVFSLISIKLITNYVGPEGTGFYNTITTYFNFLIVIADFGLFAVAVREISKDPGKTRKILYNVFFIRLVTAVFVTVIAIGVAYLTDYPEQIKLGVAIASLFPIFNLLASVYDMYFQSRLEMRKVIWAEFFSRIAAIVGILIAMYLHLGFYAIVGTISLAAVVGFLSKAYLSRHDLPFNLNADKEIGLNIIKLSLPLGIVFIVNNIYFKIDTLILFYYKGAVDVGIYAVAYRVLETTLFAGSYLSASLKPLLSRSVETDKEKTAKALTGSITILLFMALAITIICVSFPREIILFLSNSEFLAGAKALIILGFAGIFIYTSGILGEILIAKDRRKLLLVMAVFMLCFNISINLYLIPRYSYIGAAWATLISEILLMTLGFIAAKRVITIKLEAFRIFKLFLVAVVCVAAAYFVKKSGLYFIFNLAIITFLYMYLAYITDAIPRNTVREYIGVLFAKFKRTQEKE